MTEVEDAAIGSEADVDAFGQTIIGCSQLHTEEDGKESGSQDATLFNTISNEERLRELSTTLH